VPPRRPVSLLRSRGLRVLAAFWALLLVAGFVWSVYAFSTGRPVSGRTGGRAARRAFDDFGPGAFAVDSTIYLLPISLGVAAAVAGVTWLVLHRRRSPRAPRVAFSAALVTVAVGSLTALALDIGYALNGVPFRNFQLQEFANVQGLMYALTMTVPAVALAGVAVIAWRLRTTPPERLP
jgi:hypothetical protein